MLVAKRAGFEIPDQVKQMLAKVEAQRLYYDDLAFFEAAKQRSISFASSGTKPGEPVEARPFILRDPATLPRREFLFGRSFARKLLTGVVSPGGWAKSSLMISIALALVTARPFLGVTIEKPRKVWIWNLEDDLDELARRIHAVAVHFNIYQDDLDGRLFVDGRDRTFRLAVKTKSGFTIFQPVADQLVFELRAKGIDMLVIDPFVSSHGLDENDNVAMDALVKTFALIADRANCSIVLVHHSRKIGSDGEVTAESSRGASAFMNAIREGIVLNRMTAEEAEKFGIDNRRQYFRVYSDKANLAPPAADSDWYHLASVDLANGDQVGVVERWYPSAPSSVIPTYGSEQVLEIQLAVEKGDWRYDVRAKGWVGELVAMILRVDPSRHDVRRGIKDLVDQWIDRGYLIKVNRTDSRKNKVVFLEVGSWID